MVGRFDDGHAFELNCFLCKLLDQRSGWVFSDLRLRAYRWGFGVGGALRLHLYKAFAQPYVRGPAISTSSALPFPLHRLRPQESLLSSSYGAGTPCSPVEIQYLHSTSRIMAIVITHPLLHPPPYPELWSGNWRRHLPEPNLSDERESEEKLSDALSRLRVSV